MRALYRSRPLHRRVEVECLLEKAGNLYRGRGFFLTNQRFTTICTAHKRWKMLPRDAFSEPKMRQSQNAFAVIWVPP